MALFGIGEKARSQGKKHWTNVIKNTGPGGLLLWRQPEEDFNTGSTLIVMPGECAVFVSGGKSVEVFESGTYQLSTGNYPFLTRLQSLFSGGVSVFHCAVYFVRKADSQEIRWGTETPIQVRDKRGASVPPPEPGEPTRFGSPLLTYFWSGLWAAISPFSSRRIWSSISPASCRVKSRRPFPGSSITGRKN
ncbi:hypothetical protein B5E84_12720 [Lachnoclostridium sp. An14]|nr:hypothetical protein B5E84_12720 [Lachnoclostridium sp. An14]